MHDVSRGGHEFEKNIYCDNHLVKGLTACVRAVQSECPDDGFLAVHVEAEEAHHQTSQCLGRQQGEPA
jgi:hypothetical protein